MVFDVRCFKCGEPEVRLVLGGRNIIHARCHACESNLLAEVMEFERQVNTGQCNDEDSDASSESDPGDTLPPVSSTEPNPDAAHAGS